MWAVYSFISVTGWREYPLAHKQKSVFEILYDSNIQINNVFAKSMKAKLS